MGLRDDFPEALAPWLSPDLEDYAGEIGGMFEQVEEYVGPDEERTWLTLLDADLTPKGALPYLAQFVGERLPLGIPEADARLWIKDHPNQRRGTLASIISTAKRRLTGDKSVLIRERDEAGGGGDNPDRISVVTYTSETPDPAATYKDLRAIVPADIVLNYEVFEGQTWNEVLTHGTWQDVMDDYPTWRDVFEDTP